MVEEQSQENQEVEYASFSLRIYASLIDTLLSILLLVPLVTSFSKLLIGGTPPSVQFKKLFDDPAFVEKLDQKSQAGAGGLEMLSYLFSHIDAEAWAVEEILKLVAMAAVVIIFWVYREATPGKMLLKMRIVDADSYDQPSMIQWILRFLGYVISVLPLCFGFMWVAFDKRRQGFHDKIANTVVIRDTAKKPVKRMV